MHDSGSSSYSDGSSSSYKGGSDSGGSEHDDVFSDVSDSCVDDAYDVRARIRLRATSRRVHAPADTTASTSSRNIATVQPLDSQRAVAVQSDVAMATTALRRCMIEWLEQASNNQAITWSPTPGLNKPEERLTKNVAYHKLMEHVNARMNAR